MYGIYMGVKKCMGFTWALKKMYGIYMGVKKCMGFTWALKNE